MSDATSDRDPFELVAESFLARYRAGERPSLEELAVRHPELAGPICKLLPAMVRIEQDLSIGPVSEPGAAAVAAASWPASDQRLGDYRILREIGRGGMGVVYEAEQLSLGRRVALKVLQGHVARDRVAPERFRREAKSAARLHHTNIVPVFEVGRDDDVAYYAMQFIQGQGLDQVIDELARLRGLKREQPGSTDGPRVEAPGMPPGARPPTLGHVALSILDGRFSTEGAVADAEHATYGAAGPPATESGPFDAAHPADFVLEDPGPARSIAAPAPSAVLPGGSQVSTSQLSGQRAPFFRSVAEIGRQAAQGLAYAHASGIVHRDIKPSNLLLDHAGVVWIADFGLAKAGDDDLTETGDLVGTLRFMAPERFRGEGDARADIYALGLTLYELLTLHPAYHSSDRLRLIEKIQAEEPRGPRSIDGRIPRDLETIVLKATDKDPRSRYQSAEAMAEDLRRFLAAEPILARQVGVAERYWRWARRNKAVAVLGGVLAVFLVAVSVGSIVAASYFRGLARSEFLANQKSQKAERVAVAAEHQAVQQRDLSRRQSAKLALDKGLALAQGGHADRGMLWMLEALETAPEDDEDFRRMIRWNLAAWLGQVHKPLGIFEDEGQCSDLAFSPDGRSFASGFFTGEVPNLTPVVVRESASGRKLATLRGAFAPFAFRPDGKVIVAVAEDWRLVAIELSSGRRLWTAPAGGPAEKHRPCRIGFLPDGSAVLSLISGSGESWLSRLDPASGEPLGSPIRGWQRLAVSSDGRTVASGRLEDGKLNLDVIDIRSGRQRATWKASTPLLVGLLFGPDGRSLYSTYALGEQDNAFDKGQNVAQIWDPGAGLPRSPLLASTGHAAYAPSADRIVTRTDNRWLLRDVADGRVRGAGFPGETTDLGVQHEAIALHPDSRSILVTAPDNTLRLVQLAALAEPVSESGADTQSSTTASLLARQARKAFSAGLRADGRVAALWTVDVLGRQRVRLCDPATGRPAGRPAPHYPGWTVRVFALSPEGERFVTGSFSRSGEGEIRLFDARTGQLRLPPISHTNDVSALAFHPDGKLLAAGDYDGLVRFWDTSTGSEVGRPLAQGEIVWSLAYSPDGKTLAVGLVNDYSGQAGVRLWDIATGKPRGALLPTTYYVSRLEFRPDGRAVLAGDPQGFTNLWDAANGRAIGEPIVQEAPGPFDPDGRAFLTTGMDGTLKLRDAATAKLLKVPMASPTRATCAAFRSDGALVVAGHEDGTVRLCDPAASHPVGPPLRMRHAVHRVAFLPDGRTVAAIDQFGESQTWPVPEPITASGAELMLRVQARTGLRMEPGLAITRLDARAWREQLERLGRLDPAAVRRDEDPSWQEPMIREAEQAGNAFAAIWHLDRLIAARPDEWVLHVRRARAWSLSNGPDGFDRAADDYRLAERLGSRELVLDYQAHCVVDCTEVGRWDVALWYLNRLIAARPNDVMLHEDCAAVYGKLRREADRQAELARAFELGADEGPVIPRAEELGRAGRWTEAASLLGRCARNGPLTRELARAWGIAALRARDRGAYREACAAVLDRLGPEPTVILDAFGAASLFALGPDGLDDYRPAMRWFEDRRPDARSPGPIFWHRFPNALGGLLLRAGRIDEAVARLTEGLTAGRNAKSEESPTDWAYLALAHARTGRLAAAHEWLDRLRGAPHDPRESFWDIQERDLLRSEAEALLLDAGFPGDPFQCAGPS
jgi:WD40 repeat protein/tetratricopeptide (TPR) repeat protein